MLEILDMFYAELTQTYATLAGQQCAFVRKADAAALRAGTMVLGSNPVRIHYVLQ